MVDATLTKSGAAADAKVVGDRFGTFGPVITITKNLTLTTDWQDTGITGADLATGMYVVLVGPLSGIPNLALYSESYVGILYWYGSETNSDNSDEILLHSAGHASNLDGIYLRTKRRARGEGNLTLQIASKRTSATATTDIKFQFRRLI